MISSGWFNHSEGSNSLGMVTNKGKWRKMIHCSLSVSYQLTWEYIKCNVSMCLNMEYLIASKLRHSPNNIWGTIEHKFPQIEMY